MLLLGLIAIVQATVLPGLILVQLLDVRGFTLKCLLTFAFSLTLNFEIVFALTLAGLYTRSAMMTVFVAELLVAAWLFMRKYPLSGRVRITLFPWPINGRPPFFRFAHFVLMASAFCSLVILISALAKENPGVFHCGDDVVSWNRWALEWFGNRLPWRTWEYPQLLPANLSTTYLMTNSGEVEMFAKGIMAFFPIAVISIFFDAYRRFFSIGALAAIVFCSYLFLRMFGSFIGSGYADIPVTFFALLSVYLVYLYYKKVLSFKDALLSIATVAAGAVLTKQAGLFVMVVSFVLLLSVLLKEGSLRDNPQTGFGALIFVIAVSLLVIPWYALKAVEIKKGDDMSNVKYVMAGIHQEKDPLKRVAAAVSDIEEKTGLPRIFLAAFLVLLVTSLKTSLGRASLLFVALPYFLVWAAFFSYDNRNLAIAVPFFSLSAGEGISVISGIIRSDIPKNKPSGRLPALDLPVRPTVGIVLSVVLLLALLGSWIYPAKKLTDKANEIRRRVGDAVFNQKLYKFYKSHGFKGKIISTYVEVAVLPEIRKFSYVGGFRSADDIPPIDNNTDICEILNRMTSSEEIGYIIIHDGAYPAIFASALRKGTLASIFSASGMTFYEVRCRT